MTSITLKKRAGKNHIHHSFSDKVLLTLITIFLVVFFLIVAYPILYVLACSVSDPAAIIAGKVTIFPVNLTLEGLETTLSYARIYTGLLNSMFYACSSVLINLLLTVMCAYPLSRPDFQGRNAIMFLCAFTMWFSGGMIPGYMLVRDLGMLNTIWAIIIPSAMSVYNMIIMRTYFQSSIPLELLESAQLDGCSDLKFLWSIVLPLSGPILAVIGLYAFVAQWNSYFDAFLYLSDRKLYPMQLILREILLMNDASLVEGLDIEEYERRMLMGELLKYSSIVISSIPVIALYPFVQKYFVKGVMIGALKG
ncbi:MAG: carbohydrate ABC transporter permease [Aristaeellaceae bacterium]